MALPCNLPHTEDEVGKPCPVCKKKVELFDFNDIEPYRVCSEYCATVPHDEIEQFLAAKEGEWCCYPCPECGFPVQDEKHEAYKRSICAECAPKVRAAERVALLKRAERFIQQVPWTTLRDGTEAREILEAIEKSFAEGP